MLETFRPAALQDGHKVTSTENDARGAHPCSNGAYSGWLFQAACAAYEECQKMHKKELHSSHGCRTTSTINFLLGWPTPLRPLGSAIRHKSTWSNCKSIQSIWSHCRRHSPVLRRLKPRPMRRGRTQITTLACHPRAFPSLSSFYCYARATSAASSRRSKSFYYMLLWRMNVGGP